LPDSNPEAGTHPVRPAAAHLATDFLGFPLSSSRCCDWSRVRRFCGM